MSVLLAVDEHVVESADESRDVGAHALDERRDAVRDGSLDGLGRRLECVNQTIDDLGNARVGRVEMTRETAEELMQIRFSTPATRRRRWGYCLQ